MNPKPRDVKLRRFELSDFSIINFDSDILIEVFSRLPANSIIRCKRVCKEWHKLLSNPNFTHNYAINPPFITSLICRRPAFKSDHRIVELLEISDNGDCFVTTIAPKIPDYVKGVHYLTFVGSCNGLMCFLLQKQVCKATVYICNPITGDFTALPQPKEEKWSNFCWNVWNYQFGVCPFSNNTKVLKITDGQRIDGRSQCEIFTVGVDDKWRCLDEPIVHVSYWKHSIVINGACNFIGWEEGSDGRMIFTFHIGEEKMSRISPPRGVVLDHMVYIGSINNQLCLVDHSSEPQISVWIMQEYGVEQSWAKQIILTTWFPPNFNSSNYNLILVEILPNGEILFLASDEGCIISCDPKEKKSAIIKEFTGDDRFRPRKFSYSPCFEPLKEVTTNASSN